MSLTNPNKVVTEERLSEFYGQILPYMGGMPDVLANKFSKSDLYSTDEKMIGCWIDGKPIYQMVFILTSLSTKTLADTGRTIDNFDFLINGSLSIKNFVGGTSTSSGIITQVRVSDSTGKIYYYIDSSQRPSKGAFILQYTKTTDSPIAIGSDTDYSTTEKIVGTWIDGRPVYQRVAQVNVVTGEEVWTNVLNISSYNIDTLIHSSIKVNQNQTTSKGVFYPYTLIDGNNLKVYGTYNATVTHVILQYTKTS